MGINQKQIINFEFDTKSAIKAVTNGRNGIISYCAETGLIYKYVVSGASDIVDDLNVLITGAGGNTRWVAINPDHFLSAGCYVCPPFTDNGDGSITIPNHEVVLYDNSTFTGFPKKYTVTGGVFSLTDGVTNYVVADYNSNNPILRVITNVSLITESEIIPVYTIFRSGIYLHSIDWDTLAKGLSNKIHQSIVKTQRYRRESGAVLSEYGTRNINLTSAVFWMGANKVLVDAIASATDNIFYFARTGGAWVVSTITQYNNTEYSDGTDTQTLTNNRYAVNWLYRGIESQKHLYMVLGSGDYSLIQAQSSQPPANLPVNITSHAVLVGRIIVLKGAATATQIDSAFNVAFSQSTATNHNDLALIQGGVASEYYHLTSGEYAYLQALPTSDFAITKLNPLVTLIDTQNNATWTDGQVYGSYSFKTSDASGIGAHVVASIKVLNDATSTTTPAGNLCFYTAASNANETERMRISGTGFVGIGTLAPSCNLEIKKNAVSTFGLLIKSSDDANLFGIYEESDTRCAISMYNASAIQTNRFDTNGASYIKGGRLGLMTSSPSYDLSLEGNSARTIALERHSTANTAGNNLTIQAGGATLGATDKAGGTLFLNAGQGTGTGISAIKLQTYDVLGTGTTDQSLVILASFYKVNSSTYNFVLNNTNNANLGHGISINGDNTGTVGLVRHTIANTAGSQLTIQAGGATSGATDKNGGNLLLASGMSTGTGASSIRLLVPNPGSTGVTDNTPSIMATFYKSAANAYNLSLNNTTTGGVANGISMFGDVASNLLVVRQTQASTGGANLVVRAGGAYLTGTDLAGGELILHSGTSTGTGRSGIQFWIPVPQGSTNTTDNAPSIRAYLAASSSGCVFSLRPSTSISGVAFANSFAINGDALGAFTSFRGTVANTAGYAMYIQAGGATGSSTDKDGGQLYLRSGISTGTGIGQIILQTPTPNASTNTTDNAYATRLTIDNLTATFVPKVVVSSFQLTTSPGLNKILTSDANGNASWQTGGSGGGISKYEQSTQVDFGFPTGQEGDTVVVTVADTNVATGDTIICVPSMLATADHDPDDYLFEQITAYASDIVNGVGYNVNVIAPNNTWGKYIINSYFLK